MRSWKQCPKCAKLCHPVADSCLRCGADLTSVPVNYLGKPDSNQKSQNSNHQTSGNRITTYDEEVLVHESVANPIVAGWLALAGAIAVTIGSFGPWAEVFAIFAAVSVKGTDGDGKITAVLGVAASILLFARLKGEAPEWTLHVGLLCLLASGGIGIYHCSNLSSSVDGELAGLVSIGWGLYAVTIGGSIGAIAAIVHIKRGEMSSS